MKSYFHKISALLALVLLILPALAFAGLEKTKTTTPGLNSFEKMKTNGEYVLDVFKDDTWQEAGSLSFDKYLKESEIDLSKFITGNELVKIRLTEKGGGASHIDSVLLGKSAPSYITGSSEDAALALKKISARDFDVIDSQGRSLVISFETAEEAKSIFLTARVEPESISKIPFQFPVENFYRTIDESSGFYAYSFNSKKGSLNMNGNLADDDLGQPFFKEYSRPGSGHPSDYTYGWVSNDEKNLYVALDFVPDNTMDGDKDYAKVYIKTPAGVREFKTSVPEQRWGIPGFTYTERASYQHKVYEFGIPLGELGMENMADGEKMELAFAAYGTAALPELTLSKTFTDDPVGPGENVTLEFTIENLSASAAGGLAFSDDLDAVIPGLEAIGLPLNDVCGLGSQISGTSFLAFTGGSLAPGGICTFSITLQVPVTATAGAFANTTSTLFVVGLPVGDPATDDLVVVPSVCITPPSGMISWWGGDNNALDMVGTNNGTLMNGADYDIGMVGESFSFDGTDDYVQTPDSSTLDITDQITIDAWINPSALGSRIVDKITAGSGDGYLLDTNGGVVRFIGGSQVLSGSTLLSLNTWTHIAGTYDGATMMVYVNGVPDSSVATNILIPTNNLPLRIGADSNGENLFSGLIDEVEIFNRALSADEIAAIYNAGSAGKCNLCVNPPSNMVSWWRGEDNTEDSMGDNNGTLIGDTFYEVGKVGQAFSFDGAGDYVNIPGISAPQDKTYTLWVKINANPGTWNTLIEFGNDAPWFGITDGGQVDLYLNNPRTSSSLNTGEWYHIAYTSDSATNTSKIYINGVQDGPDGTANTEMTTGMGIGYHSEDTPFNGLIDEVAIFNRALTADEIAAIYNAGSAGKCRPLPDLTGEWYEPLTEKCKVKNEELKCKVKGKLILRNIGEVNAHYVIVRFYLSDDDTYDEDDILLKAYYKNKVNVGKDYKKSFKLTLPVGMSLEGRYIIVHIDAEEATEESNESNNFVVSGAPAI